MKILIFRIFNITLITSWLYGLRQVVDHIFTILSNWLTNKNYSSLNYSWAFSLQKMATLRNKRKLAAVAWKTPDEHPRNGQSRNTSVPRINEEHITEVSEEIEGRITKKVSQELNRTETLILGAVSKSNEFLLNPQIRTHSGTFRNTKVENQEPNEDRSQDDPHPEVGPSVYQSRHSNDSDPDEAPHSVETAFLVLIIIETDSKSHPKISRDITRRVVFKPGRNFSISKKTCFSRWLA